MKNIYGIPRIGMEEPQEVKDVIAVNGFNHVLVSNVCLGISDTGEIRVTAEGKNLSVHLIMDKNNIYALDKHLIVVKDIHGNWWQQIPVANVILGTCKAYKQAEVMKVFKDFSMSKDFWNVIMHDDNKKSVLEFGVRFMHDVVTGKHTSNPLTPQEIDSVLQDCLAHSEELVEVVGDVYETDSKSKQHLLRELLDIMFFSPSENKNSVFENVDCYIEFGATGEGGMYTENNSVHVTDYTGTKSVYNIDDIKGYGQALSKLITDNISNTNAETIELVTANVSGKRLDGRKSADMKIETLNKLVDMVKSKLSRLEDLEKDIKHKHLEGFGLLFQVACICDNVKDNGHTYMYEVLDLLSDAFKDYKSQVNRVKVMDNMIDLFDDETLNRIEGMMN